VPKDDKSGLPTFHTEDLRFPSFSKSFIGTGISFYCSTLHNDAYSIIQTKIDSSKSTYSLKKEKNISAEIGIAALLHFGEKTDYRLFNILPPIGYNFVIGPAVSISNTVKPRLSAGGGITFGTRQMLSINMLLIAGYTDRLSSAYDENSSYLTNPVNPTVSKLSFGFAFSVGYIYNFGK
jgi:hypothetical protein